MVIRPDTVKVVASASPTLIPSGNKSYEMETDPDVIQHTNAVTTQTSTICFTSQLTSKIAKNSSYSFHLSSSSSMYSSSLSSSDSFKTVVLTSSDSSTSTLTGACQSSLDFSSDFSDSDIANNVCTPSFTSDTLTTVRCTSITHASFLTSIVGIRTVASSWDNNNGVPASKCPAVLADHEFTSKDTSESLMMFLTKMFQEIREIQGSVAVDIGDPLLELVTKVFKKEQHLIRPLALASTFDDEELKEMDINNYCDEYDDEESSLSSSCSSLDSSSDASTVIFVGDKPTACEQAIERFGSMLADVGKSSNEGDTSSFLESRKLMFGVGCTALIGFVYWRYFKS